MMKFVFVLCVAVALLNTAQTFKVITIYKGVSPPTPAAPAAPAFDSAALIQGVQSSIASKLQQVQSLVTSLIQQKTALKQNALNSIQSTLGSVKSQAGSGGFVVRKSIYIGTPKSATSESTTSADATTTSG